MDVVLLAGLAFPDMLLISEKLVSMEAFPLLSHSSVYLVSISEKLVSMEDCYSNLAHHRHHSMISEKLVSMEVPHIFRHYTVNILQFQKN